MSDRAQVSGGPWFAAGVIVGVIVLAIVVDAARSQVASVEGPVSFCGLCGVDWRPAAALLSIGALVAVVSVVARSGVAPTVFRGGDDD